MPSRMVIALPAYNEEKCLGPLLDRVRDVAPRLGMDAIVMVVNDGSSDATAEAAESHPLHAEGKLRLVNHPRNMGLAAGMRTAIREFLADAGPDDLLVALDADNTHDPAIILDMLPMIRSGADIVIASRFQPGAKEVGLSLPRKMFSRGVLLFMRILAPVEGVRDYSCGFRTYRASILREADRVFGDKLIESTGFSVMAELLIKCASCGAKVAETPFILRYDRKEGRSKIRIGNTIAGYMKLVGMHRNVFREAKKRKT